MLVHSIPYPAAASFMLGDDSTDGTEHEHTPDFSEGWIVQAAESGVLTHLHARIRSTAAVDYRLVIYQATDATNSAGPKLGETAIATSGGAGDETVALPALASVSITANDFYFLTLHKGGPGNSLWSKRRGSSPGGFRFLDTFAGGAVDPAPTGVANGGPLSIWGTG